MLLCQTWLKHPCQPCVSAVMILTQHVLSVHSGVMLLFRFHLKINLGISILQQFLNFVNNFSLNGIVKIENNETYICWTTKNNKMHSLQRKLGISDPMKDLDLTEFCCENIEAVNYFLKKLNKRWSTEWSFWPLKNTQLSG